MNKRLSPERLEEIRNEYEPKLPRDIRELFSHIDALEWELKVTEENSNSTHQTNRSLHDHIHELEAEISRYERKKDDYSNCYAKLFNDLTTLRSQADAREAELKNHINALEEEKKERLRWMDFQAKLLEKAINRVEELEKRNDT